ncbi:MAG: hypothetical protein ACHQEM_12965 [Chitinophagales bacterium]
MKFSYYHLDELKIIAGENDYLKFGLAPALGGKIVSIFNKQLQKEFLWTQEGLPWRHMAPGTEYDLHFYGGMDELLPNDIPENIDGIDYPDHGELWTTSMEQLVSEESLSVFCKLNLSGLYYKKNIRLDNSAPVMYLDYLIRNESDSLKKFLWKLHPALRIEAGDELNTSAQWARVVDPGYSRFKNLETFQWPWIEGTNASRVPGKGTEVDFFFLWGAKMPEMNFVSGKGKYLFSIQYDQNTFPFQWYFASYGGFMNHYTAILEPCSSMPLSVNEAARSGQCSILMPGERIVTTVRIFAGESNPSAS